MAIDDNGLIKAKTSRTFWGLDGVVLSLFEYKDVGDYKIYISPILYNGISCNMYVCFDKDNKDGFIYEIVPTEMSKQSFQLKEGDKITPVYPIGIVIESGEAMSEENLEGETITIGKQTSDNMKLEQVELAPERCWYGFTIRDMTENYWYSSLVQ